MKKPHHSLLVSWLFADANGQLVIIQFPNVSLWAAVAAWIGLHWAAVSRWHMALEIVYTAALIVWAVQEIGWGASRFRRILGAVVLGWVLIGLAMRLMQRY